MKASNRDESLVPLFQASAIREQVFGVRDLGTNYTFRTDAEAMDRIKHTKKRLAFRQQVPLFLPVKIKTCRFEVILI